MPQNILVGVDGVARITDFGIAFASARSTVTQEGRIKGKFSYIAPEQIKSQQATRRMDVFSAGAVLWEALTGRPLFRRQDEAATVNAVLNEPIPPPSRLVPSLPGIVDTVVLKALEREPSARYQTAADFADALERLPIDRATMRAVGLHVENSFAAALVERRKQLRTAPEQRELETHSRTKPPAAALPATSRAPSAEAPTVPPPLPQSARKVEAAADDIEHRRLRGLLAAAMLLLVGSALGLLLARSGPDSSAPAADPSAKPGAQHKP
jgi:serine/threonine-protein kinase